MKYDLKNILLGIMVILSSFLFYKWYFSSNTINDAENVRLESENKVLKKERVENQSKIDSLTIHYKDVEINTIKAQNDLIILRLKFALLETNATATKKELDSAKMEIKEGIEKIAYLKLHPYKRTGEELLNSLDEKIKSK